MWDEPLHALPAHLEAQTAETQFVGIAWEKTHRKEGECQ